MSEKIKTLNVRELISMLKVFPPSYKVYLSRDSEGNGYGTLEPKWSFAYNVDDKALVLYPFNEYIDDEVIFPKQQAKIDAELAEEQKQRERKQRESMEISAGTNKTKAL